MKKEIRKEHKPILNCLTKLPAQLKNRWYSIPGFQTLLQKGGFPTIPFQVIGKAIQGARSIPIKRDRYKNVYYFCFGIPTYNSFFMQTEGEMESYSLPENYFLEEETINQASLLALNLYKHQSVQNIASDITINAPTSVMVNTAISSTTTDSDDTPPLPPYTNNSTKPVLDLTAPPVPPLTNTHPTSNISTISTTTTINTVAAKKKTIKPPSTGKENTSKPTEGLPTGLKIVDIDCENEWISVVESHGMKCGHKLEQVHAQERKWGFEITDIYTCHYCGIKLNRRSGSNKEIKRSSKIGRAPSQMNNQLAASAYIAGINPSQFVEFCSQAGIIHPTNRSLAKMYYNVKNATMPVSKQQLRDNRREHVAQCRAQVDYKGDIPFSWGGRDYKIARGPIAGDGAGEKRAYQHLITGDQHAFVIFSLMTGKPIYVRHDQISCINCSRKLTERYKEAGGRKNLLDSDNIDVSHPGKTCYKNSKNAPGSAESWAFEGAGRDLLIDPETGEINEDEAIFADEVCTDGDTKGANKFIAAQAELIGDKAHGEAVQVPDIGHFIKNISNAFYTLTKKNKSLRGQCLLEPVRIKCISSDVRQNLLKYHLLKLDLEKQIEHLRGIVDNKSEKKLTTVNSHDGGNHRHCSVETCKFIQVERKLIYQYASKYRYVVADCLDNNCIRAIVQNDIVPELKLECKTLECRLKQAKQQCLDNLAAVVPHHAGDHSHCCVETCMFLQLERKAICRYRAMNIGTTFDTSHIKTLVNKEVVSDYSRVARFKGKALSLGQSGVKIVTKIITDRITEKNIDRLSRFLSSNACESYFGVLTKYSQGKRIYQGKTDAFKVHLYLVAGLSSNPRFADEIFIWMGIPTSLEREKSVAREIRNKASRKRARMEPHNKERRQLSKIKKLRQITVTTTLPERHKPEVLSPLEDCKSGKGKVLGDTTTKKRQAKPRREIQCGNCRQTGHNRTNCPEPLYNNSKTKSNSKSKFTKERVQELL